MLHADPGVVKESMLGETAKGIWPQYFPVYSEGMADIWVILSDRIPPHEC